jgi:uncharacterized protein (DUF362 family)/Pyruvate/2-oxoacid:ferredoxin oxidoreductase delta subunit
MNTINNKVSIERCGSYNPDELYQALKTAAQAAGIPEVKGKTILLKPNILMDAEPEKAITTHPAFLEAVIRLVQEWGASRILAGDSPSLQGPRFTARVCGIEEVIRKSGIEWVDFTKGKTELKVPKAKVQRSFTISGIYDEVDMIINLPKLKTHQLMYFTGAMKNMFGLIPSLAKSPFHVRYSKREDFASMIVDLNMMEKPVYALMDAVLAMEGPGPSGGTPRKTGLVLASSNFLAMDIAACAVIGYPPQMIPVNREALARQIWLKDIKEIEYPLLNPGEAQIPDFEKILFKKSGAQIIDFVLPKPLKKLIGAKSPAPYIDHTICIRCGDCMRICAPKAISVSGSGDSKQMEINRQHCIRCYCCHEICPAKAIEVKPGYVS